MVTQNLAQDPRPQRVLVGRFSDFYMGGYSDEGGTFLSTEPLSSQG